MDRIGYLQDTLDAAFERTEDEVVALADEQPEPIRHTGRCLPYGRGITYWPLGEILREQLKKIGILQENTAFGEQAAKASVEALKQTLLKATSIATIPASAAPYCRIIHSGTFGAQTVIRSPQSNRDKR